MALCLGCASVRPGTALKTFPEVVWEEYDCENQKRPFFVIEKNELLPEKVAVGSDFDHRLVYVLCPEHSTEVVQGSLSRRIRLNGMPIVEKTELVYEIKPGRWVMNTTVYLPEQAELGIYVYEVDFNSLSVRFEKSLTFIVVER
jgi:hypothetical protein